MIARFFAYLVVLVDALTGGAIYARKPSAICCAVAALLPWATRVQEPALEELTPDAPDGTGSRCVAQVESAHPHIESMSGPFAAMHAETAVKISRILGRPDLILLTDPRGLIVEVLVGVPSNCSALNETGWNELVEGGVPLIPWPEMVRYRLSLRVGAGGVG